MTNFRVAKQVSSPQFVHATEQARKKEKILQKLDHFREVIQTASQIPPALQAEVTNLLEKVESLDEVSLATNTTVIPPNRKIEEELKSRLRQQAAVAELGQLALEGLRQQDVFDVAVRVLKNVLQVDCIKVLELLPNHKKLMLRAGIGWNEDVVIGVSTVDTGNNSQAGYTLRTKLPVIVRDLPTEQRFTGPPLLKKHGIISGMSVIISGNTSPFGVLGVHSKSPREFSQDDINFLLAVANILAATVQRRVAEQRLIDQKELFTLAYEAAQIGAFEWNIADNKIKWTREMEILYGLDVGEFGETLEDWLAMVHPADRDRVEKEIQTAFSQIITEFNLEFRVSRSTREVHWFVCRASIMYENGKPQRMVGVNLDITRRKLAEIHKDEFIGIVSHELKTPVTSLKAYAQVMQRRFLSSGNTEESGHLAKMMHQLDKLTSLIGDLLDVTKIEQGRLQFTAEKFDFDRLVAQVIEELQPTTIQHSIIRDGLAGVEVVADRERVGQVLVNFISNAIKYSPRARRVIVHVSSSDTEVQVGVQDFGVGLAEIDIPKVFERFYRVERPHKNSFPGLGLGLFISAEIIKRLQGKIWVESVEGKGSCFYFAIPKVVAEESSSTGGTSV